MKNNLIVPVILVLCIAGLFYAVSIVRQKNADIPTIGIIQTASHPALDAIYDGFIDGIGELFEKRPVIIHQNAQGQIAQAQTIAQSFHVNQAIKLILSIATPTTQALLHKEHDKPIIFSAVTDAQVLGIPADQHNICGLEDRIDVDAMTQLVSHIALQLTKKNNVQLNTQDVQDAQDVQAHDTVGMRVGIVYNPSEVNSVSLAQQCDAALTHKGFMVQHYGVYHEQEITSVITAACRKVALLIAPTDNMVALSIDRITDLTYKYNIPFIASDVLLVNRGATAACGVDYYQAGRKAAEYAYALMHNKKNCQELGIAPTASFVVYNKERMAGLGLEEGAL